jgi:hypothetical protein
VTEETTITTKESVSTEPEANGSHFFSVSTRSIITLIIVATVCAMAWAGKKIDEPLYTLSVVVVGFYFGQNQRRAGK